MARGKIRVAIIGGGLGGTALMNSLMRHNNIDAHIYEAKDTFKERGASVGLAGNAQRALRMMGLKGAVEKTGAVPVNGARFLMGEGKDAGKLILHKEGDLITVHRAALLRELVDPIPKERMHTKKKLVSIEDNTITFDDGSSVTADVIIGADGIHSSVRQYVLEKQNIPSDPVHAGIYDCRTVIPYEEALSKLGPDILRPEEPRQTIYCGDGNVLFLDFIEDGTLVCILAAGLIPDNWDKSQWTHTVSREWLLSQFRNWPPFAKDMIDLLSGDSSEISAFIEWESSPTSTLNSTNTVIIGDAAHATTPWQGAGLGQALEDALIIQAVLGECRSTEDIPRALGIFDNLMRPRGRRIIESSRGMAMLYFGKEGLDAEALRVSMTPRWDFIHDWDTEAMVEDVVRMMRTSEA